VNFDSINVLKSKLGLDLFNMGRALTPKFEVNPMPHLQQGFEQKASAPTSWVKNEIAVVNIKHCDDEPSQLAHRKILTKLATKHRAKEVLKSDANVIYVCP